MRKKINKTWNNTLKAWVSTYKIWFFKYYIFSYANKNKFKLFLNKDHEFIHEAKQTNIFYDVDELLKEYGTKWAIPVNKDWRFIRNGQEIKFNEI